MDDRPGRNSDGLGFSTDVWTTLPAGDLWIHGSQALPDGGGTATDATVALQSLGAAENDPCAAPPVHDVEAGDVTAVWRDSLASATSVDPATGEPRIATRFRLADARSLDVIPGFDATYDGTTLTWWPYDGAVLTICREACPDTNPGACTSAPLDAPVPFPFGGAPLDPNVNYTLVVSGAPTWRGVLITLDLLP